MIKKSAQENGRKNPARKLLIVNFPFESAFGGLEEIHLLLAKKLRERKVCTALVTSCPHLHKCFANEGFQVWKFWWRKTDPVAKSSIFLFPFLAPFLLLAGFAILAFFRAKGWRKVLLLRLQEKMLWTLPAKVLGFEIFFGEHCAFGRWIFANPLLPIFKAASRLATFVCPSIFMKGQIHQICPWAKVKVLPNAIEPIAEKKVPRQKEKLKVGFAARLGREKGVLDFLKIAQSVLQEFENVTFEIAGRGPLRAKAASEIRRHNLQGKVLLRGFLQGEQLQDFFTSLDVFGIFSQFETFGISILHAQNAGKPTVGFANTALGEVVASGHTGFLVKNGDTKAAAKKIVQLLRDKSLREQMGKRARETFLDQFTAERFLENAWGVFNFAG